MKKLKAELKRLRQELIMKPATKGQPESGEGFTEEMRQALKMLSGDQRKTLEELEQAGCNRAFLEKKIRACI